MATIRVSNLKYECVRIDSKTFIRAHLGKKKKLSLLVNFALSRSGKVSHKKWVGGQKLKLAVAFKISPFS